MSETATNLTHLAIDRALQLDNKQITLFVPSLKAVELRSKSIYDECLKREIDIRVITRYSPAMAFNFPNRSALVVRICTKPEHLYGYRKGPNLIIDPWVWDNLPEAERLVWDARGD